VVTHKITGIELNKLLLDRDHDPIIDDVFIDGTVLPEFISERFCQWNFSDAKVYNEIFNFPAYGLQPSPH